jgi:hypothetical protein
MSVGIEMGGAGILFSNGAKVESGAVYPVEIKENRAIFINA